MDYGRLKKLAWIYATDIKSENENKGKREVESVYPVIRAVDGGWSGWSGPPKNF